MTEPSLPPLPLRRIVHIDMDAFYAAVEIRDQPGLGSGPLAVAHQSRRGVILTANYAARVFGVRSAMPTTLALERCPQLRLVPPRMEVYRQVSGEIRAILLRYTPLVEFLSLDEAYLDVTRPLRGPPSGTLIARAIKADIRRETGLTASAGVSSTRFLAKIASDLEKPDGLTVIHPDDAEAFIAALPVESFHGVGPATAARLHQLGIQTGADLRAQPLSDLHTWFGERGRHFYRISRGIDERPVEPDRPRKSVGAERTFEQDVQGIDAVRAALDGIVTLLVRRLGQAGSAGQASYQGRVLVLKLKFTDRTLLTRRVTAGAPLLEPATIRELARQLVTPALLGTRWVRLVGLSIHGPPSPDPLRGRAQDERQPQLFGAPDSAEAADHPASIF